MLACLLGCLLHWQRCTRQTAVRHRLHALHALPACSLAELRASEKGLQNLTLLNPSDGPESQLPCQPNYHVVLITRLAARYVTPSRVARGRP